MNILVFGDSITWGAWDSEGGWVERLRMKLNDQIISSQFTKDINLYNLGIHGDNTEKLLERLEPEIIARQSEDSIQLIIAIGINDLQYWIDEKRHTVQPEVFSQNLERILSIAKNYSNNIAFIGLTPVDDEKMYPDPEKSFKGRKNAYVEHYNNLIKDFTIKKELPFIDIYNSLLNQKDEILADGLHPNNRGHEIIADQVSQSDFFKEYFK